MSAPPLDCCCLALLEHHEIHGDYGSQSGLRPADA